MKKETIRKHLKVMLAGILRVACGTATTGLFALAVHCFAAIPSVNGYFAVCEFFLTLALCVAAVGSVYVQGMPKREKAEKKDSRFSA